MSSNKEDRQAHAKLEEPLIAANVEEVPAIALPDTIEVIAPATLPEGYTFEAEVGGNVFLVTVVSRACTLIVALFKFYCLPITNYQYPCSINP